MGRSKRSYEQYRGGNGMGVGDTLAALRKPDAESGPAADDGGDWQVVESKAMKKRKKSESNYPSISHSSHARLQGFVKVSDLQNLCLYLLADGTAPQWCSVRHHTTFKKVVVLMVPGLESDMFNGKIPLLSPGVSETPAGDLENVTATNLDEHAPSTKARLLNISPDDYYPVKLIRNRLPESLQPLADLFPHLWSVKTPGDEKYCKMHSPLAAFLVSPIVKSKDEKQGKGVQPPPEGKTWTNQRTPITEFVASPSELMGEGYVLHPALFAQSPSSNAESERRVASKTTAADGWVDSRDIPHISAGEVPDKDIEQGSVTAGRKILAMDCEMCITSPRGVTPQVFSLTRISVVDWDDRVVLDEYVKPADPITDYLTAYSGITPEKLENVTTTLADIQQKLLKILTPHTILIGHSLNSDLNALKLTHPFIIDTTLLFPHPRGPPLKSSLKFLAQKYLSRQIQTGHGSTGHNSIEDARACLDLVKQKCEKGKFWGTPEASGESFFKRLARSTRPKRDKVHPDGANEPRSSALVDWGDPTRGYGGQADLAIGCKTDAEVVDGIRRTLGSTLPSHRTLEEPSSLAGSNSDPHPPPGGCDFIWARFRELEAFRGWWNQSSAAAAAVDNSATDDAHEKEPTGTDGDDGGGGGGGGGGSNNGSTPPLADVVTRTVAHISAVHAALPPCSALLVYSGSGDPRELVAMQALQQQFRDEYRVRKWDELSVRWTDDEEQRLREACRRARKGIALIGVK